MTVTRKTFVALAAELRSRRPEYVKGTTPWDEYRHEYSGWSAAVVGVAEVLRDENPRFKRATFLRAAGVHAYEADGSFADQYDAENPRRRKEAV